MLTANDVLKRAYPVMPVMVVENLEQALPLANALHNGGIDVFEITLRTPCALSVIRMIKENMPQCLVGAGTVLTEKQLMDAYEAGADFIITPGATPTLLKRASEEGILLVPGVSSASDVMAALSYGYDVLKLFPAEAVGGVGMLQSLMGPFPEVKFCPTGGISLQNYKSYLAMDNVHCVGGSWVAPEKLIRQKDWSAITKLAMQASE